MKIQLYTYTTSPFAAKVHCFLLYKQLPFECFYINPLRLEQDLPLGRQIPVLSIGVESRADSTLIGIWLDEQFPNTPLLLPKDSLTRTALLSIDQWVTDRLIPGMFRFYLGSPRNLLMNGWKLGATMNQTARGGLPWWLTYAWPIVLNQMGFIRRLIASANNSLSIAEATQQLIDEFMQHLADGPFLGGKNIPSLPDFSAYPPFAVYYQLGLQGSEEFVKFPLLLEWIQKVSPYLRGEPALIPPQVRRRDLTLKIGT